VAPRREHSRKPDEVRDRIERLLPGPRIELFARTTSPGWDSWGDQTSLFDGGSASTRRQPSDLNKLPLSA
jgi:N6-adenosine-specific RNA methylase IME4